MLDIALPNINGAYVRVVQMCAERRRETMTATHFCFEAWSLIRRKWPFFGNMLIITLSGGPIV